MTWCDVLTVIIYILLILVVIWAFRAPPLTLKVNSTNPFNIRNLVQQLISSLKSSAFNVVWRYMLVVSIIVAFVLSLFLLRRIPNGIELVIAIIITFIIMAIISYLYILSLGSSFKTEVENTISNIESQFKIF
jgi:hypothetical protein